MNTIVSVLPTLQIVLAVLMIISILLQQSEESLGGAFGGSDALSSGKRTRRGGEKFLFQATISIAILFVIVSIFVFLTK